MKIDRHTFLMHMIGGGAALATALLLGFPALADDPSPSPAVPNESVKAPQPIESPAWLTAAREAMKRTGADGIALVVPEKARDQAAFKRRLAELLEAPGSYDVHEALVSAVFVCAPAASVDAKTGETAVLLGTGDGKRVAGCALSLESAKEFADGVRRLLATDERFGKRAKAARTKAVNADLARAVGDARPALDARNRLIESFDAAGPAVIAARAATTAEEKDLRGALESIVQAGFARQASAAQYGATVTTLPFGAQWFHPPIGDSEPDPCPPCGMAIVQRSEKVLLELLTQDPDGK